VADRPPSTARTPGWREVLIVAAIVVAVVLGAAFLTGALPTAGQDVVFRTPLAIVVIAVGTVGLLAWLARRPAS
jgi:lysozyme family protein